MITKWAQGYGKQQNSLSSMLPQNIFYVHGIPLEPSYDDAIAKSICKINIPKQYDWAANL